MLTPDTRCVGDSVGEIGAAATASVASGGREAPDSGGVGEKGRSGSKSSMSGFAKAVMMIHVGRASHVFPSRPNNDRKGAERRPSTVAPKLYDARKTASAVELWRLSSEPHAAVTRVSMGSTAKTEAILHTTDDDMPKTPRDDQSSTVFLGGPSRMAMSTNGKGASLAKVDTNVEHAIMLLTCHRRNTRPNINAMHRLAKEEMRSRPW